MSQHNPVLDTLHEAQTSPPPEVANQITLIDRTVQSQPVSSPPQQDVEGQDAEHTDSEADLPPTPSTGPLLKKLTNTSLQQTVKKQISRQKYSRYTADRFESSDQPPDEDPSAAPQQGDVASPKQTSYLERSRAKAKNIIRRKRTLHRAIEEDSVIDILYENQRGSFLFGVPRFSSSSLLNFDPRPWQNISFRTSPVDIRNAQVPDPSWEWAWKSWYVDMSRDVDEEGWEYSFSFQKQFVWHGNHPWFHSFVRRRRWLRKRVRKDVAHKTKEHAHELTAEYFTIHPKTLRSSSPAGSAARASNEWTRRRARLEDEPDVEKMDIPDIASLIRALRKSSVDREKLVAVRRFVDQAQGDELYYLAERMSEVMSSFIYQSARRQLLGDLTRHFDGAKDRRESLAMHEHDTDNEDKKKEHDVAVSRADYLLKAVKAAEEQVKKLEYWSDIKGMAQMGEIVLSDQDTWDPSKWRGLASPSTSQSAFESKQHHSDPVPELHQHPEHVEEEEGGQTSGKQRQNSEDTESDSGYTTAPSVAAASIKSPPGPSGSIKSPTWTQRRRQLSAADSDLDLDRYVTASEADGPEQEDRTVHRGLDGVMEEDENDPAESRNDVDPLHPEGSGSGGLGHTTTRQSLEEKVPDTGKDEGMEIVAPEAVDVD